MSGYINNSRYIQDRDPFTRGAGFLSSKSVNELFDLNGDGIADALERDKAESIGLMNMLESISPVVARAYSDHNFRLQTGAYLTDRQIKNKEKVLKLAQELSKKQYAEDIPIERRHDLMPFSQFDTELDSSDIKQYTAKRRYLEQSEIDNDP